MSHSGSSRAPLLEPLADERGERARSPHLAPRLNAIVGSPLRALLSSAEAPAAFDLAGGIPDPDLFPREAFARAAERILVAEPARALQYAPTEGLHGLREWFAARLRRRGADVSADQILITHGSQHALATVALLLGDKGSPVAIEQPAFLGAEQAFGVTESRILSLPLADGGWDLDALRGSAARAVYVNPDHQNPTGRTATRRARAELARAVEREGAFLIEDDAYSELSFTGELEGPIFGETERAILIGTLSKTLCPGIRVGFIAAPRELIEPLTRLLQAGALQPGTLAQALALEVLEGFDFDAHRARLSLTYGARARALKQALDRVGVRASAARGGFYLWIDTEGEASQVVRALREQGLSAVPEAAFRVRGLESLDRHVRLSFSRLDPRSAAHVAGLLASILPR